MADILKYGLLVAVLAILTIWFGKGFEGEEKPIKPEPNPLQSTIDAAHKAAEQMSR